MISLLQRWRSKFSLPTKNFEKDHAAVMAMIGDFKDKRFREMPPDPRQIDPERLRQLRERLTNKYAYQWRSTEANGELVDALFHTIRQADGIRYGLGPAKIALNEKGESPGLNHSLRGRIQRKGQDEFQVYYYITARSMNVLEFITRYDHAVRLLQSLLPEYGSTIHSLGGRTIVRLEKDGQSGLWIEHDNVALGLVLAILLHLERAPFNAQHWRSV